MQIESSPEKNVGVVGSGRRGPGSIARILGRVTGWPELGSSLGVS